ncbi:G-D-S-L family lipolytic protein [Streptomyces abyssalis]|uniref:G-D-S-L family lipolytic protein n=1 Tax=Streptomyces abyssalis TaxID=933944 RepID=A0A1E7JTI2_9ACTN|nr:SGNH/GDSL hydrolase family protein [Streptomyces abyssalis]OEU92198.1 G-D-S-L family lipolytic protein [Streptomyces abyssalis]OEU94360.1 G-D-S-L family lipolytic protein [Streptomyces abyssalis]
MILLTAAGTPAVAVAESRTATDTTEPLPLERLFDNRAVSDDARPGEADFDGAGNSLSAQDLRAAGWNPGRLLGLDSASLRWPHTRPGRPDNVTADGQQVRLSGTGNAISLLVAGTSRGAPGTDVTGTGTVRYWDGSTSAYSLSAPDWRGGPLATKAVALPKVNTRSGGPLTEKAKLYAVTVPVHEDRRIRSITLPRDPGSTSDLHVFAASVRREESSWTGSWTTSTAGYTTVGPWENQTLRLVVHTSAGGSRTRIKLANTFASGPVEIGHASVVVQREGATGRGRPVRLQFGGRDGVVMPAGTSAVSDPVGFQVPSGTNLLVSLHLPDPVAAAPVHSATSQRSYVSGKGSGDRTGDTEGSAFTGSLEVWPFLTAVDVRGGPGSVVAFGDSITDGVRSTPGANRRWPDVLSRRLRAQQEVPRYGVLNQGISANRVVSDRYPGDGISDDTGGVSAVHRLERDVLAQTNAHTVVVFEGINDVRWGATPEEVIAGLKEIARRAHERGLRVVGATLTPCEGYKDCFPEVDAKRSAVNAFVRDSKGTFDAVLDFDAVVRDPARPQRMLPAYDSGDHLHPGDAGLKAMADSVELKKLVP